MGTKKRKKVKIFTSIILKTPKPIQGGTFYARLMDNNKPLLIQTPKCLTKNGIHKTGKKTYDFFSQEEFAWILDTKEEQRFIKAMKKASRVMIIGRTEKGKQTIDHYSLMGFTKAYNTAKKNCS